MSLLQINYESEYGGFYSVEVEYNYIHRPAVIKADPNDSCADESELEVELKSIYPTPNFSKTEECDNFMKLLNSFIESDYVADKCIEDYNNAIC